MSSLGDRLKEERNRLGVNQGFFAELGGVKRNSQVKYEKGERNPDSSYLAAISDKVDILYIVTGIKSLAGTDSARESSGNYHARIYDNPTDALDAVLEVQGELQLTFNAEQLKTLLGYAYQHQMDSASLNDFVRIAFAITGRPLEDK